jgi:hypothetical protein
VSDISRSSDNRAAKLLLKAIRTLSDRDQDTVLAFLLEGAPRARRAVVREATATLAHTTSPMTTWPPPDSPWIRLAASSLVHRLATGASVEQLAAELGLGNELLSSALRDLARRPHPSPRLGEIFGKLADGKTIAQIAIELKVTEAEVMAELEPSEALAGAVYSAVTARAALPAAPPAYLGAPGQGPLRTMPVRFPEAQYERLKKWCEEHNFPMAVVVRGVVERFLDEQQGRAV